MTISEQIIIVSQKIMDWFLTVMLCAGIEKELCIGLSCHRVTINM